MAVDLQKAVARLKTAVLQAVALHETAHRREIIALVGNGQQEENHDAGQEIHGRTSHQNQKLRPEALLLEGTGVRFLLVVAVLPFHGHKAADGQKPQGIPGTAPDKAEQPRPHAQGKLVDLDAGQLGCDKMSQLVEEDDGAEHQHRSDESIQNGHVGTCLYL